MFLFESSKLLFSVPYCIVIYTINRIRFGFRNSLDQHLTMFMLYL